jgi:hypothetical protein
LKIPREKKKKKGLSANLPGNRGGQNHLFAPQKVCCSAFKIKLKYEISIILLYIYIVSICIGYVIEENEIVKNVIKCLFEGKTRRCLMG